MKSIFKVLFAFLICSSAAFGQWSIGPKVSFGTITQQQSDIRIIPNADKLPPQLTYMGGDAVYSVGFMLYNQIGPGFLQIEALGTSYSQTFLSTNRAQSPLVQNLKDQMYIMEIPVAAGFGFGNFRVGGGPVLEVTIDRTTELRFLENFTDKTKLIDGSFQGLVGYKKGIFNVDARYTYKFSSVIDNWGIGDDVLKLNRSANRLTLSVGILFGGNSSHAGSVPTEEMLLETDSHTMF